MTSREFLSRLGMPIIIATAAFLAGVAFTKLGDGIADGFQRTALWIQLVACVVGVVLLLYVLSRIDSSRTTNT
jgi:membrane associated rhomboid family serine protease